MSLAEWQSNTTCIRAIERASRCTEDHHICGSEGGGSLQEECHAHSPNANEVAQARAMCALNRVQCRRIMHMRASMHGMDDRAHELAAHNVTPATTFVTTTSACQRERARALHWSQAGSPPVWYVHMYTQPGRNQASQQTGAPAIACDR